MLTVFLTCEDLQRMDALHDAHGLLIDMDGVLWRGRTFLPGVKDLFTCLRSSDTPFLLVTNNSTETPASIVERLAAVDVAVKPGEVLTSSLATAAYLQSVLPPGANIFAIGDEAVHSALKDAGFQLQDDHDSVHAVVVGFDHNITWHKLTQAALAIQAGALFVGTNPDVSFPIEGGQAPGNGAFILAIQAATSVTPTIVGKPEPLLFEQAVDRLGIEPPKVLMVGDRLETDILGAQRVGMATALLLTGVTSAAELESADIQPDFVFKDLMALTAAMQAGPA